MCIYCTVSAGFMSQLNHHVHVLDTCLSVLYCVLYLTVCLHVCALIPALTILINLLDGL